MKYPRHPFRLNVGFIVSNEVGFSNEFPFDFDQVLVEDDLEIFDFHGSATVGRTPQGLLVTGHFVGKITTQCVRCLREFQQHVEWKMTELYAFNANSVTDSGLLVPEDARIDLAPLIRDYALLEIPISPICQPDCKGLCPVCGQDLNLGNCGHRPGVDDSPFSALSNLL